ncbi:peptidase S9B dipeptidylpeptidase IV domain protein [Fibrisoma limi BUZ 3]|uniref:Peptidase S9B dipeptidylpeptidase IV domain protein n=1 Tax=Fibrisoma limi BUZ 3 TaxID=1185876 RepID=I2GCB2_9BACT|nr:S9 family peptidase [Fibrisoma limi]CCH51536.1 peptidase S9B dipeptidylpeptidase IV domain protein [Fibrisoma limi BUZ 3]
MKYIGSLLALLFLTHTLATAQMQRAVTLDDVWGRNAGVFTQRTVEGVNWMKTGGFYTTQNDGRIVKFNITTGQSVDTLFDQRTAVVAGGSQHINLEGYQLSADERKLLITTDDEPIYRRSSRAQFYVYDLQSGQLTLLSKGGKQLYATFSPDGKLVAFVRDNNLFVVDLATKQETQLTTDGKQNAIINGAADWVYEEEFTMSRAFEWSPDSRRIAWIRFDESRVPEYNMQLWGNLYPIDYRFKYPKAGEANSTVTVWIADVAGKGQTGKKVQAQTGLSTDTDIYLPRIQWTQNPNLLSVRRLNRLQNRLDLLHINAATGQSTTILTETSPTYVDLEFTDDLTYLRDGKAFVWSSERSGFKHLYLHDMSGKLIRPITSGEFEAINILGVDEKNQAVYYLSTEDSPLERQLYRIGLDGRNKTRLTKQPGTYSIKFNPDFTYYLEYYTSTTTPTVVTLRKAPTAEQLRVLETNSGLTGRLRQYAISPKRFFTTKAADGTPLNGFEIRPLSFDSTKKYPVLMFVYGGPGSQTVENDWDTRDFFWYQVLADKGYVIVSVDNRGTGARGTTFRTQTYAQLGKLETQDQIAVAQTLKTWPYVDPNRVGIWGWSYGGYMTALCMTLGADTFKMGISVAPVTTWRFYDTIYTERYLKRPQENPLGYDENSPLTHAAKLRGPYLLIHGTGDDNVHFQNSVMFEDALIRSGKQFQSFYYPNRNHGISGGNTRLHLYQMMTNFIEKNL